MKPNEVIIDKIYLIRGEKVMLDRDLAELYQVETKRLKEQVKRNIGRFPEDFMFELTKEEFENWRSQFATSNS
ncbi:MAG: ORF6N domain-containing protein, partial [Chitinophagales bacterium]